MKRFVCALCLAAALVGCADPYVKMEGYFVKEGTAIQPADNVEKAVAEFASYRLYRHREESFPEVLTSLPEFFMKHPLPPQWLMLFFQVPDRWEFRPINEHRFEGRIHFRKSAKDGKPKEEVKVVLTNDEMVRLARDVVDGPAYLNFLKNHDRKYKYNEVYKAAEYVRNGLLREIITSSVPADVGKPMVPILLDAAEKGYYTRFCIQNLQIITGHSFGYSPESLWDPELLLTLTMLTKSRQQEALKQWREWYETTHEKTAGRPSESQ